MVKFHQKDTTYQFKAVVGKPSMPTPLLQGSIMAVTRDRDGISLKLNDGPLAMTGISGSASNKQDTGAFSDGTVRIAKIDRLAALILKNNRADLTAGDLSRKPNVKQTRLYTLKKPMPVRVTYITCEVGEWGLIRHEDVYHLDQKLEKAFYEISETIALRLK